MNKLLLFFVCLPLFAITEPKAPQEAKEHGDIKAKDVRRELDRPDLFPLARRTDWALTNLVHRATQELRARGERELADRYEAEWSFHYQGALERAMARDIGDHAPLIQWLADFYDKIEAIIGVQNCKALHLSDIKTFNFCIPVVFRPCTFPMDAVTIHRKVEYRNHFVGDSVYYGLVPVVTYWAINIPCMIGTAGIAAMLCGPAASVGEYVMYKWFAPGLSDRLFARACE